MFMFVLQFDPFPNMLPMNKLTTFIECFHVCCTCRSLVQHVFNDLRFGWGFVPWSRSGERAQFVHEFWRPLDGWATEHQELIRPFTDRLKPAAVLRIKANLQPQSDGVYEEITGIEGVASTKILYVTEDDYFRLDTNDEVSSYTGAWNSTIPNDSVVSLGVSNILNEGATGQNQHMMYCWHSVSGYSSFGRYTGDGNGSNKFI